MVTPTTTSASDAAPEPSPSARVVVRVTLTVAVDIDEWIAQGYGTDADTSLSLRRKVRADVAEAVRHCPAGTDGVFRLEGIQ